MGFFNKLFGKENKESNIVQTNTRYADNQYHSLMEKLDGAIAFEVDTPEKRLKEFYDKTRIVVKEEPEYVMGQELYDCFLSWYREDDCIFMADADKPFGRKGENKHVIAGIDKIRLQTDEKYLSYVANMLFDKERIEKYLETSKMTSRRNRGSE